MARNFAAEAEARRARRAREAEDNNKSPVNMDKEELFKHFQSYGQRYGVDPSIFRPLVNREATTGGGQVRVNSFNPEAATRGPTQMVASTAAKLLGSYINEYDGPNAEAYKARVNAVRPRGSNDVDRRTGLSRQLMSTVDQRNDFVKDMLYDPQLHAYLATRLMGESVAQFRNDMGRDPSPGEQYGMWFLGAPSGIQLARAAQQNPHAVAEQLFPGLGNKSVFRSGGKPRTVSELLGSFEHSMNTGTEEPVGSRPRAPRAVVERAETVGLRTAQKPSNPFLDGINVNGFVSNIYGQLLSPASDNQMSAIPSTPNMSTPTPAQSGAVQEGLSAGAPITAPVRQGPRQVPMLTQPAPAAPGVTPGMPILDGSQPVGNPAMSAAMPGMDWLFKAPAAPVGPAPQSDVRKPIGSYADGGLVEEQQAGTYNTPGKPGLAPPVQVAVNGTQLWTGFVANDVPWWQRNGQPAGPGGATPSNTGVNPNAYERFGMPVLGAMPTVNAGWSGNVDKTTNFGTFSAVMNQDAPLEDPSKYNDVQGRNSFEVGGNVGPGGENMDMTQQGGAPQAASDPQAVESQIQEAMQNNPEQVAQIRQVIMEAVQSGELTPQELNTIGQLAQAALRDPSMYPQLRSYAVQNGVAEEADLPPQYDEGLVVLVILAIRSVQSGGAPAGKPGIQPQQMEPLASFKDGGALPNKSPNASGEVPITAHEGEFVLHAGAVAALGLDKLRKLNDKYDKKGNEKPKEKTA